MKKLVLSALLIFSICLLAEKPFQIGIINPLQLQAEGESIKGLKVNLVHSANSNVTGIDLGFVSQVNSSFTGLQWNFINFNQGNSTGIQLGTVTLTGGMTGLQWGLINFTQQNMTGLQLGFLNVIKGSGKNFQIGLINYNPNSPIFMVLPFINFNL